MKAKQARVLVMAVFLLLILGACNLPSIAQPPPDDVDHVGTQAALTVAAELTLRAGGATSAPGDPTSTDAPTTAPDEPTYTYTQPPPTSTFTLTPTLIPSVTNTSIPCDQAAFIGETIDDNTEFDPSESFLKTWQLKNTGSCTWTSSYHLVFFSGDSMSGASAVQLTSGTVAPGQTVNAAINLTAPASAGTYKGSYKLRNSGGVVFGITNSNDGTFWVQIVVKQPAIPVDFTIQYNSIHTCGGTFYYPTLKLVNTGTEFLSSVETKITDLDTSVVLYGPGTSNVPFRTTPNSCPIGENDADPGNTYYLHANIGGNPLHGHTIRYRVKACTQDWLGGTCVTKSVTFDLP